MIRVVRETATVLPLSRNEQLSPAARDLAAELRRNWNVDFDDAAAIGKRYRRQDEIGTPFCVTVDFDTLEDHAVTIRERDSMAQSRVPLAGVTAYAAQEARLRKRLVELRREFGDLDPPGYVPGDPPDIKHCAPVS